MQEKRQQIKLPSAWKADEWICHHSSSRQSIRLDDYFHRQSKMKSPITVRNIDTPLSSKRISTAKLRRQIENLSFKSTEYRVSGRKSKVKRLTDTVTPVSYRSFLTYASRHGLTPPIIIPKMSKQSLKRWLDARDAYLGHNYPYIQERFKRRHRQRIKSTNETYRTIDYDEAISIFSIDPDRYSNSKLILSGKQRRLSRKDSSIKRISQSEINLRRSGGLLQRIKSFVQSPVSSLSRLSCRKQKQTQIIYDYFDDKCVGTEINERTISRTNIRQNDQAIQVNLPRPQYKLYHEFDTSMVVGEKQQRIRSVRRYINYSDKATDTDFILNFINVEKERREEKNMNADENDKSARRNAEKEKVDPYTKQSNVQQQLSTSNNTGNQIVPPIDLLHTSMGNEIEINNNRQNGSRSTILSPTESNISVHEQLHRLRVRFNRLSKERRLLAGLLILFAIIMCGLLVGIFILSWTFQGRTSIIYREINSTDIIATTTITNGVARYGESCDNDTNCEQPFVCYKKGSSIPGMCRCPMKYDFVKDQCIGDLNALCTKDTDCQRYMSCSGMKDGTRRCQCETQFNYDDERRRCRGDYEAPCESNIDCRANLVCNKTNALSFCSCDSHYNYHPSGRKCRGNPGAVCDRLTAECVDNAECRDGACECSNQFVPDENKVCIDPCPAKIQQQARIRYPGNCKRFIDCQHKSKTECPEMTIFNLRTQLCDYPKNVFDCR